MSSFPMSTAPKNRRILLDTPAGVFIGRWVDEHYASDCARAVCYAGWLTEGGETWPGNNFTDQPDQHGMPISWMEIPNMQKLPKSILDDTDNNG